MLRIVNRYLLKEIIPPFFLCLVAFSFVLLMDKIMRLTELVVNKGVGLAQVGKLFLFLFPSFLTYTIPVAVLLAILIAFSRLASDHEIMAMKAAGISLYQLVPAVMAFAFAASLLAAASSIYLAPLSNQGFLGLLFQITKSRASLGIKERVFNQDFHDLTIYVNKLDLGGQLLKGVMVSDRRQDKAGTIIVANQGYLVSDTDQLSLILKLENGSVHRTSADLQSYHKLDFDSYELRLELDRVLAASQDRGKRFSEMLIRELMEEIDKLRGLEGDLRWRKAQVEFHKKFAFPLAGLVFALVAIPLGIQSKRAGRLSGFTLGLGVLFLSYLMLEGGKQLALRGMLPAALSVNLGNLFYLGVGLYLFVAAAREKELWFTTKLEQALETFYKWVDAFKARLRI